MNRPFILLGTSNYVHDVDVTDLTGQEVMAVNAAPMIEALEPHIDYYMLQDVQTLIRPGHPMEAALRLMANRKCFLAYDPQVAVRLRDWNFDVTWFYTTGRGPLPHTMGDPLVLKSPGNVAGTACSLIYLLGGTEIYLKGVDLIDTHSYLGDWAEERRLATIRDMNSFLTGFPIPVYKTEEKSPLLIPYKPIPKGRPPYDYQRKDQCHRPPAR